MRDEEPTLPKCQFCSQKRDGVRYNFWAAFHVLTSEQRNLFAGTTTITSRYRDMTKVGIVVCHECIRKTVIWGSLPTIVISSVCAIGLGVAAYYVFPKSALTGWLFVALGGFAVVTALFFLALIAFPHMDYRESDSMIRNRAARYIKEKGKGSHVFTQTEYEVLFVQKPEDRAETAEELMAGIEDDDEPRLRRGRASDDPTDVVRCPNCNKSTPGSKKRCKYCKEKLP